ncbi:MAG: hypothetical protein KKH74_08840 [Gammaproteobacteria bacterium]|nr:hypothetical protein [Gammaproteobacteria bacterium]MBU1732616.1 hypothetical protein [Gammaproteobacteria bacterium]MBU1893479.1 hypothetical protein [Gammaproteobacteria bacterium]
MTWFQKEMDYARENLEQVSRTAIDHASEKLDGVVREGIAQASGEMREVVLGASREVDAKLDKISAELHSQRQFTKSDVKEMVDYAADRLGVAMDERTRVMKSEITALIQEKVEYLKHEVDAFFIQRQQDLARERRRLIANVLIAVTASVAMGILSLMFHRVGEGSVDMLGIFRIVFASLGGGYLVYLLVNMVIKYRRMSEHRKDFVFLTMKYWGILRPESLFSHALVAMILFAFGALLFFPEYLGRWLGSETLLRWAAELKR